MNKERILKRIEQLQKAIPKQQQIVLVYKDGHRRIVRERFERLFEIICAGSDETGIVDILPCKGHEEESDGFYRAFRDNEKGCFIGCADMDDDSDLLPLIDTEE